MNACCRGEPCLNFCAECEWWDWFPWIWRTIAACMADGIASQDEFKRWVQSSWATLLEQDESTEAGR